MHCPPPPGVIHRPCADLADVSQHVYVQVAIFVFLTASESSREASSTAHNLTRAQVCFHATVPPLQRIERCIPCITWYVSVFEIIRTQRGVPSGITRTQRGVPSVQECIFDVTCGDFHPGNLYRHAVTHTVHQSNAVSMSFLDLRVLRIV